MLFRANGVLVKSRQSTRVADLIKIIRNKLFSVPRQRVPKMPVLSHVARVAY